MDEKYKAHTQKKEQKVKKKIHCYSYLNGKARN